jgi:toxin ParE1/3/4
MTINFLSIAEHELSEIFDYYEQSKTGLGKLFFKEFDNCIQRIKLYPYSHRKISEKLRKAPLNKFPYYILYTKKKETVLIMAIAHYSRKPNFWINRF